MTDHLKVFAGLKIEDGCPMRYFNTRDGEVAFVLGGRDEDVEVLYSRDSLNTFVALANEALADTNPPVDD